MDEIKPDREYQFKEIESKWQRYWEENETYHCKIDTLRNKYYCLVMYPYPSGRVHMGHVRNYVIGDVFARFKRMNGFEVLHPIGWDAFGMPAENAAIKKGINPRIWTQDNIKYMRHQLKQLGISYDWSREIATCTPEYYKWNQWFFLAFYNKGLAYRGESSVNWCFQCQTVLANEQVNAGKCWRCDSLVEQKSLTQWFFRTRHYVAELLNSLTQLKNGWPDRVLVMQENWFGKSYGTEIDFNVCENVPPEFQQIKVFTTRADTLFGATFLVLSPEHPLSKYLVQTNKIVAEQLDKLQSDKIKSNLEVTEKVGFATGLSVINPVNNEKIPVWIANYVLIEYGTGAIMSVPAHDLRDYDFARKYGLPIREVIRPLGTESARVIVDTVYEGEGMMVNSDIFTGLSSTEGKVKVTEWLTRHNRGVQKIEYRLKDWLISRQRYWGTPIPVIYCKSCGTIPVPESDLPVVLPEKDVVFTGTGESPLAKVDEFVNTTCPRCNAPAKRETDTMDTFVDSSWYYLRYCDPHNSDRAFSPDLISGWIPVHQYIGGIEHACMHLIYARFFHKSLRDLGLFPPEKDLDEPFRQLLTQGMVTLGGSAMSKSKGNIIEPEMIINQYGVDTLRLFLLFAAPPEKDLDWADTGIDGAWRFINRVWRLVIRINNSAEEVTVNNSPECLELTYKLHQTIKRVTEDISRRMQFNTAIAAIMELVNLLYQYPYLGNRLSQQSTNVIVKLLNPFVPHIANELWQLLGNTEILDFTEWPNYEDKYIQEEEIELPIQVNGKLRSKIKIPVNLTEQEIRVRVNMDEKIYTYTKDRTIKKVVYIPNRLLNFVVE